jgi:hypothetical protein
MSEFSTASTMTVSYFGEELQLAHCLDKVFHDLQKNLNETHVQTRNIVMMPEQDNDFHLLCDTEEQIHTYCDDMICLLKELKSVCTQIRGKPQNDAERNELKARVEKKKLAKAALKLAKSAPIPIPGAQ